MDRITSSALNRNSDPELQEQPTVGELQQWFHEQTEQLMTFALDPREDGQQQETSFKAFELALIPMLFALGRTLVMVRRGALLANLHGGGCEGGAPRLSPVGPGPGTDQGPSQHLHLPEEADHDDELRRAAGRGHAPAFRLCPPGHEAELLPGTLDRPVFLADGALDRGDRASDAGVWPLHRRVVRAPTRAGRRW